MARAAAQAVQPAVAGRPGNPRGALGPDADPVARPEPAATRPAACPARPRVRSRWTSARRRPSATPRPRSARPTGSTMSRSAPSTATARARPSRSSTPTTIRPSSTAPTRISAPATWPSSTRRSACPTRRASPSTTRTGRQTNLPGTDPAGAGNLNGNWEMEEALDIESGARHRPGGEHRPGRGEQRHQQRRHVHRRGDRRQAPRRVGGLDELGDRRVQRRAGRRFHVHHAERAPGCDLRRGLGRPGVAGVLPGLFAERAGGRRHHALAQCEQHHPERDRVVGQRRGDQPVRARAGLPAGVPEHGHADDPRRRVGRRSQHRRGDVRLVRRHRRQRALAGDRRHERRGAVVVGPDRHRQPGPGDRGRRQPRRADPDAAGDLRRAVGRLQRHHQAAATASSRPGPATTR